MSRRLFFSLLISLLVVWLMAGLGTMIFACNDFPPYFYTERWFAALTHASFFAAIVLLLWFGRTVVSGSKLAVLLTFSLFGGLLYELDTWPSMAAAFIRAPWANENERGPAISAPSDYCVYTWEWDMGPRGVNE